MITQSELLIIKRYLKPKKKEGILKIISIFSFLGIGLGVATLIIVMSVMNGFRSDLIGKLLLFQPHILIYEFDSFEKNKKKIEGILSENKINYQSIKLSYSIQGLVISQGINKGTNIRAITKNDFLSDELIKKSIIEGELKNFENNYASLGSNFAADLGVTVGDKITILSSTTESTPFGNIPEQFDFVVGSVFHSGIYEFDSNFILVNAESSPNFLKTSIGNSWLSSHSIILGRM